MSTSRFDILNALAILDERQGYATADDVAADLATTRQDVVPQLMSACRAGLVATEKRPTDGTVEFRLTEQGVVAHLGGP